MVDTAIGKLSRILLRYRNDNDTEAWYPYLKQAVEEYNEKPLKHGAKLEGGTSTLRMAPEEIEEDYLDAGDEEGAGEASFEMQRYAAKAASKNRGGLRSKPRPKWKRPVRCVLACPRVQE